MGGADLWQGAAEGQNLIWLAGLLLFRQYLFNLLFLYGHSVEGRLQKGVHCNKHTHTSSCWVLANFVRLCLWVRTCGLDWQPAITLEQLCTFCFSVRNWTPAFPTELSEQQKQKIQLSWQHNNQNNHFHGNNYAVFIFKYTNFSLTNLNILNTLTVYR